MGPRRNTRSAAPSPAPPVSTISNTPTNTPPTYRTQTFQIQTGSTPLAPRQRYQRSNKLFPQANAIPTLHNASTQQQPPTITPAFPISTHFPHSAPPNPRQETFPIRTSNPIHRLHTRRTHYFGDNLYRPPRASSHPSSTQPLHPSPLRTSTLAEPFSTPASTPASTPSRIRRNHLVLLPLRYSLPASLSPIRRASQMQERRWTFKTLHAMSKDVKLKAEFEKEVRKVVGQYVRDVVGLGLDGAEERSKKADAATGENGGEGKGGANEKKEEMEAEMEWELTGPARGVDEAMVEVPKSAVNTAINVPRSGDAGIGTWAGGGTDGGDSNGGIQGYGGGIRNMWNELWHQARK